MKKLLLSGIAAVALMSSVPAFAAPGLDLNGSTGVARTPMAMASAPMSLGIAADYVASDELFIPARVNFGLIDGLEIGGKFWYTDTDAEIKIYGANIKYVLPLTMVEGLSVAVGAAYDSTSFKEGDALSDFTGYAVASYMAKAAEIAIIPSVGVAYDKISKDDVDLDESGVRFFGSVVAMVMPNLGIGAEYVSTNEDLDGEDADASYWFGARFMPMENLTVQAGYLNNANITNDGDPSDGVFHVGVQYGLSFGN